MSDNIFNRAELKAETNRVKQRLEYDAKQAEARNKAEAAKLFNNYLAGVRKQVREAVSKGSFTVTITVPPNMSVDNVMAVFKEFSPEIVGKATAGETKLSLRWD